MPPASPSAASAELLAAPPAAPTCSPPAALTWDIFCHVVDNWGDLGVCWRLSRQLAARGQQVRLWVDDARALDWMAPGARTGQVPGVPSTGQTPGEPTGLVPGLSVLPWPRTPEDAPAAAPPAGLRPSDVLIEAFGCHIAPHWVQALQPETLPMPALHPGRDAAQTAGLNLSPPSAQANPRPARRLWLNLEYLSAERWVERCHGLPSPLPSGPLHGRSKWFFYPGLRPGTGGVLAPDADAGAGADAGARMDDASNSTDAPRILFFGYEPPALSDLLADPALARAHWSVCAGRSQAAWHSAAAALPASAHVQPLPLLEQSAFDRRLQRQHLNLVRGEDSLVQALWAGRALVWQLYPQSDGAHHAKLEAFLDWLAAPPCLRQFHRVWNGIEHGSLPSPEPKRLADWTHCVQNARQRLLEQADLVTQLLRFVAEKRSHMGAIV